MSANWKPSIPLDVIETIVGILANVDDQKLSSVKVCSLTSQSFLHFCRKHIFSSITLNILAVERSPPSPTGSQFKKLLITAPEVVNYVRTLSFGVSHGEFVGNDANSFLDLAEVLKKFTRVQYLSINSSAGKHLADWANLADCIPDAILHLLNLPTINYLGLSGLSHFPILELTRCINLRHLRIGYFMDPVYEQISPILHSRSVVLEECHTGWQSTRDMTKVITLEWPNGQPVFDFRYLKHFSVRWGFTAAELTRQLLKKTKQLTWISLEFDDRTRTNLSDFSDTIRHSLKSIRKISLRCELVLQGDVLIGLSNQFRMMREWPNVLEDLAIHIHLSTYINMFEETAETEWATGFDKALNNPRWSSLKRVTVEIEMRKNMLEIYHQRCGVGFDSAIQNATQTLFPLLSSNKAIDFNFNFLVLESG